MATNYRIIFENQHADGQYSFFNQPPAVNGNASDPQCFTNVWINRPVPKQGNVTLSTTNQFYAWTGYSPEALAQGTVVTGGIGMPAVLGTKSQPGSTFSMINFDGVPKFSSETDEASEGCFSIVTGTDFQSSDNFLIGLGQFDDEGTVVPVATIPADQNTTTQVEPIVKFYVSESSSVQGTTVNFASVSTNAGIVDFSSPPGLGNFGARVIHNQDGSFSTTYMAKANYYQYLDSLKQGANGDKPDPQGQTSSTRGLLKQGMEQTISNLLSQSDLNAPLTPSTFLDSVKINVPPGQMPGIVLVHQAAILRNALQAAPGPVGPFININTDYNNSTATIYIYFDPNAGYLAPGPARTQQILSSARQAWANGISNLQVPVATNYGAAYTQHAG